MQNDPIYSPMLTCKFKIFLYFSHFLQKKCAKIFVEILQKICKNNLQGIENIQQKFQLHRMKNTRFAKKIAKNLQNFFAKIMQK